MSLEKAEKGLVYKLSQKCLDQEEEIQNLYHNVTRFQEVIQKKQSRIYKQKSEINQLKAKLIDKNKKLNNCKKDYKRIQQEDIINNFEDIKNTLEVIFKKVETDKEIQKELLNYLADQGEILKIFRA